jgi:hypothetical protein
MQVVQLVVIQQELEELLGLGKEYHLMNTKLIGLIPETSPPFVKPVHQEVVTVSLVVTHALVQLLIQSGV